MKWLLAIAFLAACKGDPEKCEKAMRNYTQLVFWDKADAEIAKAPPDKRDQLRKDKLVEYSKALDKGINMNVSQCVAANNDELSDCMINAKTAAAAKACAPLHDMQ